MNIADLELLAVNSAFIIIVATIGIFSLLIILDAITRLRRDP